jgi:uncharacterized protein YndB with AHSA1/START domain
MPEFSDLAKESNHDRGQLRIRERGGPMTEFTLKRTTTAPIETVFDALTDHRAIADYVWAVRRSTLDREGIPAPNGVGAVRRLEALGPAIIEEIIEYQRPTGYAYKLVSGAPVRDHVGTIELREAGTGTEVSWHLRSTPKIPGLDWLLSPVLKRVISELFNGGIDAAEGRA